MLKRVVVLASGGGSNFENLVNKADKTGIKVAGLIVDRKGVYAIKRAELLGIPFKIVSKKSFASKAEFEQKMIDIIEDWRCEYILLAGFMSILSPKFIKLYERRILNIHPSLLPAFKGAHGIRDAFHYGVKISGTTVHYVDNGVDTGEIIMQHAVELSDKDTLQTFEEKIHQAEYSLYPEAIQKVINISEEQ